MDVTSFDLKAKWQRISARLRTELGEDLFTSWFGRMEAEEYQSGRLAVSVPTRFLKSWIESHYISKLHMISETELGEIETLQVRVRSCAISQRTTENCGKPSTSDYPTHSFSSPLTPLTSSPTLPAHLAGLNSADVFERPAILDNTQTFETFSVGSSNRLAQAAATRVAEAQPGTSMGFNPLFIHSTAGLGKTHLLNAIAHHIRHTMPSRKVLFLTAERFMYGFIQALRQRDTISFKDQFQGIDVLLIDDFQFLQGKAMQQEFCHTFNALVDSKRQIVIAADVPPAQLDTIDQRMRSRLLGGLVIDIEMPELSLRRQILESRLCIARNKDPALHLSDEVLEFVANKITGGGRELEGALNRIFAYQQFNNIPITLDIAGMVLRDMSNNTDQARIKIDDILKMVGRHYNVGRADLLSPRRARAVVMPRQIGMYLAKKLTSRSLPEIGRRFGGRDHSTVLHAVRKIEDQMKGDNRLAREVALLIRLVEQQ